MTAGEGQRGSDRVADPRAAGGSSGAASRSGSDAASSSDPSHADVGLFSAAAVPGLGRRRTAPRSEQTSDVVRFRGVLVASVAAALAVLGAVVATIDPVAVRSPGPLSRPHVEAGLACVSCHASTRGESLVDGDASPEPIAARCVGCHGPHPSARAGHRTMAQAGTLRCHDCHAVHEDFGGVALGPDGTVWRYGPGTQQVVTGLRSPPALAKEARVPLVPAGRCARCHRPGDPADPIQRCLLGDQASLGAARPTVCFDEHQRFATGAFSRAEGVYDRMRLWAAAREVAAQVPTLPAPEDPDRPAWWWLGIAAVVGAVAFGLARLLARLRRDRRRSVTAAAVEPPKIRRLPQVDTATCIGCHACVDACPYDVLEVRSFVAHVVRPDDCCGLTLCEQRCPNGSLVVTDGAPIEDRPYVDDALQSLDTPGLYVAGDLTGLPLIRNAINQGARTARAAAASLAAEGPRSAASPEAEVFDLLIVGSGPAGLSASLAAAEAGLRTVTLEQGSVAESIRSFPRGKLVFDQPLGLPLEGELWLQESTKEELLGHWRRIIRARRLPIEEQTRVTAVRAVGTDRAPCFEVEAQTPAGGLRWTARRVILALGRRGTPRKLSAQVPEAALSRVHYSLADARSLAGRRVVIVGLGDVAMEAAIALARQPDTEVIVSYRGKEFRRGKRRNVEQVQRLVAAGRIDLRLGTEVEAIAEDTITLRGAEGTAEVGWDTLLVMIGSLAPWPFLEASGVTRARIAPEIEASSESSASTTATTPSA